MLEFKYISFRVGFTDDDEPILFDPVLLLDKHDRNRFDNVSDGYVIKLVKPILISERDLYE